MDALLDSLLHEHLLTRRSPSCRSRRCSPARAASRACRAARDGVEVGGARGRRCVGARAHAASCGSASTPRRAGCSWSEHAAWIPDYGIHYYVGVDGIALLLGAAHELPAARSCSSPRGHDIAKRVSSFLFFMMALQTGMLGAFFALDLFLFYVFWETMLIPMYFIIGIWGGPRRIYATVKFFIYTMVGSLLMLVRHRHPGVAPPAAVRLTHVRVLRARQPATGILDLAIPSEGGVWWSAAGLAVRACSRSRSRSRCRCSRSTPGCPTRTSRRRRPARPCSRACC